MLKADNFGRDERRAGGDFGSEREADGHRVNLAVDGRCRRDRFPDGCVSYGCRVSPAATTDPAAARATSTKATTYSSSSTRSASTIG